MIRYKGKDTVTYLDRVESTFKLFKMMDRLCSRTSDNPFRRKGGMPSFMYRMLKKLWRS